MAVIFDIGMHRGEDTAYYLWQGHRVVALEPNPEMWQKGTRRFRSAIEEGRLRLLPYAISDHCGTQELWVPSKHSQWASLNRTIASREDEEIVRRSVQTVTMSALLAYDGMPDYLKIDIESYDHYCLEALKPDRRPAYVSVEAECIGNNDQDCRDPLQTLVLLAEAGYSEFLLVDQYTLQSLSKDRLCPRRTRAGGSVSRLETRGWRYPFGASGPWGEDRRGIWCSFDEAAQLYTASRNAFFCYSDVPSYSFWCDWHAR